MKLTEYRNKLSELGGLRWKEHQQEVAKLQAEYLSEQTVPNAKAAIEAVARQFPEMPAPSEKDCELLELLNKDSPNERWWRCRCGEAIVLISAESGKVYMMAIQG